MYYDNGYTREIYQCHNCGFDLRKSEVQRITNKKRIDHQNKLMNILDAGYYKVNQEYYYSVGLFYLVKSLVLTIMKVGDVKVKYIKQLEPCHLSKYLSHALFLLESFPKRLNRYYKRNQLTDIHNILGWEDRDKKALNLPSWYLSGIEHKVITRRGKK
jgi:hypothetical protein